MIIQQNVGKVVSIGPQTSIPPVFPTREKGLFLANGGKNFSIELQCDPKKTRLDTIADRHTIIVKYQY